MFEPKIRHALQLALAQGREKLPTPILEGLLVSWATARSALYLSEYHVLDRALAWIPGLQGPDRDATAAQLKSLMQEAQKLYRLDAQGFSQGLFPGDLLWEESPQEHLHRLPKILLDAVGIYRRRNKGVFREFSDSLRPIVQEKPAYFARNFHFQTEGYLSQNSARLYDHQVELLFGGAAAAMRRRLLVPMKEWAAKLGSPDGKNLRILEVAAGPGSFSVPLARSFPKAEIVVSDLSGAYLNIAKKRMGVENPHRISFVEAAIEKLPFEKQSFDAVVSVFLFHELPQKIRLQGLQECARVLKPAPAGFLGMTDSIQLHDLPELNFALESFPQNYHEPFYRDYVKNPMEEIFSAVGRTPNHRESIMFAKTLASWL